MSLSRFSGVRRLFLHCLDKHPLPTNMAVYGLFYTTAEISHQTVAKYLSGGKKEYKWRTVANMAIIGCGVYSPTLFFWYRFLDRKFPGNAVKRVLTKVVVDQTIMTPSLLVVFFATYSLLNGNEITKDLRESFWTAYLANQCFWVPAQLLNFSVVPPKYRVIYVATAALLWVNLLCFIKRDKSTAE